MAIVSQQQDRGRGVYEWIVEFWDVSGKEPKKSTIGRPTIFRFCASRPGLQTLATCGVNDSKLEAGEEVAVKCGTCPARSARCSPGWGVTERRNMGWIREGSGRGDFRGRRQASAVVGSGWHDRRVGRGRTQEAARLESAGLHELRFAPDSRHIVVGSRKGAIFLLRLDVAERRP